MATITWPTDIRIGAADIGIAYDVQIVTMRNGQVQTYGLPGARWMSTLSFVDEVESMQRPRLEALMVSLEGGANRLQMQHWGRSIPNGSLRGTPTLQFAAAAGAKQIFVTGANGTLLRGDIIGILGQLVMVMTDTVPSGGNMAVDIKPALRNAATVGTAVVWNKPTTLWIPRTSTAGPFGYRGANVRPGFSVDFVEAY